MEEISQVLRDFPLRGKDLFNFATLSKANLAIVDLLIDGWIWDRLERRSNKNPKEDSWLTRRRYLMPRVISTVVRSHCEDVLDDLLKNLECSVLYWRSWKDYESSRCGASYLRNDYRNTNWILYKDETVRRHINACIDAKDLVKLDLWMKVPGRDFLQKKSPLYHAVETENWEMVRYMTSHPLFPNWGCCLDDFVSVEICTKILACGGSIPYEYEDSRPKFDRTSIAEQIQVKNIPAMLELGMPVEVKVFVYGKHWSLFADILFRHLEDESDYMLVLEAFCAHGARLRNKKGVSYFEYYFRNNASDVYMYFDVIQLFTRYGCPLSPEFLVKSQKSVTKIDAVRFFQEKFPREFSLELMIPNALKYFSKEDLLEFLTLNPPIPSTAFSEYIRREDYVQSVALTLTKYGLGGIPSLCFLVEKTSVEWADEHGQHLSRCCSENRPCLALTSSVEKLERFYRPTLNDHSFPLCHRLGEMVGRQQVTEGLFWLIDNRGDLPLCDQCLSGDSCETLMCPLEKWMTNEWSIPAGAVLIEILMLTRPRRTIKSEAWARVVWNEYCKNTKWKIDISPEDQVSWRTKFETVFFPIKLTDASVRLGWTWSRLFREYRYWRIYYFRACSKDEARLSLSLRTRCAEFCNRKGLRHIFVKWNRELGGMRWVDQSNLFVIREILEVIRASTQVTDATWVKDYLESHLPVTQTLLDYWCSH